MSDDSRPRLIFHIANLGDWIAAKSAGEYRISTRGRKLAEEGFIHAATADQVEGVANGIYRGSRGLVLLVIEADRVKSEIRWEPVSVENPEARRIVSEVRQEDPKAAGEDFPHIYGPLNTDAVIEAIAFEPEYNGRFYFPKQMVDRL